VNIIVANQGIYDVVVTSRSGNINSQPVVLVVNNCTAVSLRSSDVTPAVLSPSVTYIATTLHIVVKRAINSEWIITDANGRKVMKITKQLNAGTNELTLQIRILRRELTRLRVMVVKESCSGSIY
jgi:hypothetical protein